MSQQTAEDRFTIAKKVIDSEHTNVAEAVKFLYWAIRLELAISKRARARKICERYAARMNEQLDIVRLRQDMVEL